MHLTERPRHEALEAALQRLAAQIGYERLVSLAFSAGRYGETSYAEWLDNLTGAPHRRVRRAQQRAAVRAGHASSQQQEG